VAKRSGGKDVNMLSEGQGLRVGAGGKDGRKKVSYSQRQGGERRQGEKTGEVHPCEGSRA